VWGAGLSREIDKAEQSWDHRRGVCREKSKEEKKEERRLSGQDVGLDASLDGLTKNIR
jgi:hypothetical protein